jgi:hypothetical protein
MAAARPLKKIAVMKIIAASVGAIKVLCFTIFLLSDMMFSGYCAACRQSRTPGAGADPTIY